MANFDVAECGRENHSSKGWILQEIIVGSDKIYYVNLAFFMLSLHNILGVWGWLSLLATEYQAAFFQVNGDEGPKY